MEKLHETSTGDGETSLEGDDKEITGDSYVRRVGSPWRRFFARRVRRAGLGSASGVAGRTDARRARFCAFLEGAPDDAALGADSFACRRRRHSSRHFQAVRPPPGRQPLAARWPRGLRHPVLEPGGRTAALWPGEPRQEDYGFRDAAGCSLGDACHERPTGRRRTPRRPDAVHARGRGRRLGYPGWPARAWGGATADLRSGLAGYLYRAGSPRPGYHADLRLDRARRGARRMGGGTPEAARRGAP